MVTMQANRAVTRRTCFYIPVGQFDESGYIPSLVTEGEAGHAPLKGNGPGSSPWHWGATYGEALAIAERENAARGISPRDAAEIIASSMADGGNLKSGDPIPPGQNGGMDGYVVGECGHRVAGSEWRAGFRKCERCGG
jgi:hypothetical protein